MNEKGVVLVVIGLLLGCYLNLFEVERSRLIALCVGIALVGVYFVVP